MQASVFSVSLRPLSNSHYGRNDEVQRSLKRSGHDRDVALHDNFLEQLQGRQIRMKTAINLPKTSAVIKFKTVCMTSHSQRKAHRLSRNRNPAFIRARPLRFSSFLSPSATGGSSIKEFRVQSMLKISETFSRLVTLIQWTEHVFQGVQGRLEIAAKGQLGRTRQRDSRSSRRKECPDGVSHLILIDRRLLI